MRRRHFLRGLGGVTVGLPLLDSLGFRPFVKAQSEPSPRRFVTFFQCNGANMDRIWPSGAYGALTADHFGNATSLAPLLPWRDKLLIPRNMSMAPKGFGQDTNTNGCDHQKGMGHKLTGRPLDATSFATGISVDQFIARQVNPGGRDPMTLGVHRVGGGGTGSISYRGPSQPVTSESNPRLAFQDLMGINYTSSEPVRDLLSDRRKSVLDLVRSDFERLQSQNLSKSDTAKLDLHFSTIRDLENQLDSNNVPQASSGCAPLDAARVAEIQGADQGVDVFGDASFKQVGRMQMDLIALGLACDHTRVATLQWGAGAGGPVFNWDGIAHLYNHHKLSHGNTKDDDSGSAVAGWEQMIGDIDLWFAGEFAYLLERLNSYAEEDGTLLDNTVAMWVNELSDGKAHDFRDLPCVLAGSGGGALRQGQYINLASYPDARQVGFDSLQAPHNKLLTTLANVMGATETDGSRISHFGSPAHGGDGDFDELLA